MLGKSLFCTKEIHRIGIKNQIAKYIRNRMCALKGAFLNGSGARTTKRELESVGIAVTCGSRVVVCEGGNGKHFPAPFGHEGGAA